MKLGIIFKKEFQEMYGNKQEFFGNEITIKRETDWKYNEILKISKKSREGTCFIEKTFPVEAIQLIYLGGWND